MTDSLPDEEGETIMSRNLGRAALAEDSLHLVFSRHCGETLYPCLRVTYRCEKDYINILSETTWSRTSVPFVRKFIRVRRELCRREEDRIARYERFCSGIHVGRLSPSIVRLHLPSRSHAPTLRLKKAKKYHKTYKRSTKI